jgi:predicted nucleic acid-binding protein
MIFVDTGAWYASVVDVDPDHIAARAWLDQNTVQLATSDYIIDETLTLLRVRKFPTLALDLGHMLFGGQIAKILKIGEEDIREAWTTFRDFSDKGWSFTDCTSKAVIERLEIDTAFSFDSHFRQFGAVTVVP